MNSLLESPLDFDRVCHWTPKQRRTRVQSVPIKSGIILTQIIQPVPTKCHFEPQHWLVQESITVSVGCETWKSIDSLIPLSTCFHRLNLRSFTTISHISSLREKTFDSFDNTSISDHQTSLCCFLFQIIVLSRKLKRSRFSLKRRQGKYAFALIQQYSYKIIQLLRRESQRRHAYIYIYVYLLVDSHVNCRWTTGRQRLFDGSRLADFYFSSQPKHYHTHSYKKFLFCILLTLVSHIYFLLNYFLNYSLI